MTGREPKERDDMVFHLQVLKTHALHLFQPLRLPVVLSVVAAAPLIPLGIHVAGFAAGALVALLATIRVIVLFDMRNATAGLDGAWRDERSRGDKHERRIKTLEQAVGAPPDAHVHGKDLHSRVKDLEQWREITRSAGVKISPPKHGG